MNFAVFHGMSLCLPVNFVAGKRAHLAMNILPMIIQISLLAWSYLQCLKRLVEEARADEPMVISLWHHEMQRIYKDALCRHADLLWFDEQLASTIQEVST